MAQTKPTFTKSETVGKKGRASSVDEHVGSRLRQIRTLMGYSQEKLADSVGITFQQVQKYENGANRVSAGRLYEFSRLLNVPVQYFFENLESKVSNTSLGMADNDQEGLEPPQNLLDSKETAELLRTYYQLNSEDQRKDLLKMIKTMVKNMQS